VPDPYLTPADVAARLNLSKVDGVYKLIQSGALTAVNVSTGERATWRVSPDALDQFLEARRAKPAPVVMRRTRTRQHKVTNYF
jgi:excisionase family DNA binding protein